MKLLRSPFLIILVVTIIGVALKVYFYQPSSQAPEPVARYEGTPQVGGPFTMVNQDGKTVTEADYRGRLLLVYFGYTFCPDVCPTSLSTIARVLDLLTEEERARIAPLFVTIDPERDTPEKLKVYLASFHPDLIGLTGTAEQMDAMARSYKAYYAKVQSKDMAGYTMDHATQFYLMGTEGEFKAIIGHTLTPEEIVDRIRRFL